MIKRLFLYLGLVSSLWLSIGVMAQACDQFETADEYYTEALVLEGDGFLPEAIDAMTCALTLAPDTLDYLNRRGIYYEDAEDYDLALADYDRILELDEGYWSAWNNRGNVYYYLGEFDLALTNYDEAIELDPTPDVPYYNRGLLYYEQGDYDLAVGDLSESLAINPDYKNTYLMLGITYSRLNDQGREHYYFNEWVELNTTETFEETLTGSVDGLVYNMAFGREYRFGFEGVTGQVIRVSARADSNADIDPLLVLLDENGFPIKSDDDSGVNLNAVISNYALPEDGPYTLILSHAGGGSTGDVTLTIDLGEIDVANSFATYKLFVGDMAEVYTTRGDRLNLRSGAGLEFEIVEKLDAGDLVTLLDGPRKVDGYAWWRIRDAAGNEGWAVERVEEEQTLQLALLVGTEAIVTTGGDKLNVRAGAGSGNELVFQLDEGALITLLEAPQVVDGFRWWRIQTTEGLEGWTIDRFDGDRMMIPAKELE